MLRALLRDVRDVVSEQWEYRELLYQMTARDLLVRYKQTVMGFGWAIFMPLVNTVLFSIVFTRIAHLDTDVAYPAFAYTGLLFWNFFAASLRFAVVSLSSNAVLVTKVYFPREIFPFSAILVCLVDLLVGASLLAALLVYYRIPPSPSLAYVPLLLVVQILFTAGIALVVAMANLFLRDVKYLFEMVLTVWMFGTSVVYPMDAIGGVAGVLVRFNPMTPIIDGYRQTILRGQAPDLGALAIAAVVSVVVLTAGWLVFHRAEYQFAENA
jgi:ABC-2 type transport system permease protein/lipopolysaccharide transport system permease protein